MPTGVELAETLGSYSERGMEYVKNLKGIMRANELEGAEKARLQAAPAILIIDVPGQADVARIETEIAELRKSGEPERILQKIGVDFD